MSAGTDYAITELQHAVRELAARVDSIEQARNSTAAAGKCTLTVRELTALPFGSVVEEADSGRRWRRDDDGLWYRLRDGVAANEGGLYSYELCKVGAPLVEVDEQAEDTSGCSVLALPHPGVPPMRFDRARFPKPCDLSAGSTVTDRYGSQWTKQADPPGMWKGGSNMVTDGILTLVFGPFRKVTQPIRRIDDSEPLEILNVGARVRDWNGCLWEKQGDGTWSSGGGSGLTSTSLWVRHGPTLTLEQE